MCAYQRRIAGKRFFKFGVGERMNETVLHLHDAEPFCFFQKGVNSLAPAAQKCQYKKLSEKELAGYRQWLCELDEEAREPGGDLSEIDEEVWESFNPKGSVGVQIYESYSDDELLSFVLATMNHPGHKPRFDEIYCVYKQYLRLRFGNLDKAKSLARTRRKQMEEEARWPPDWPERVSPQPFIQKYAKSGHPLSEEDILLLQKICDHAVKSGFPPTEKNLSPAAKEFFKQHGGSWQRGLLLMGIPALNKMALKHLHRYWSQERRKNGGMKIEENNEK